MKVMAEVNAGSDAPANVTIYINNLSEKIKLEELKKSLQAVFLQFGTILERMQYANTKSDVVAKADGTFVPREKRKKCEDRGKKQREQHDANQAVAGLTHAFAGAYGVVPPLSQVAYPGGTKSMVQEAAPPNSILFVQNLPHETTTNPMMPQMLFCQYVGFKEVRMVEAKPGIAFVEYENEMQSTQAMQGLQSFKITQQNPMLITYAKK